MAQQELTVPLPIIIKLTHPTILDDNEHQTCLKPSEEVLSDSEEVHCRICHKAFATTIALRNHARMDHTDIYATGDPSLWTKSQDEPVVISKAGPKKVQNIIIQKKKQDIISSMAPTSLTSLASNNVSYIIIKSDDQQEPKKKKGKKEKETKKVEEQKRSKSPQAITGPFECLEASSVGVDGVCHQMFFSCCAYSRHARQEHSKRCRVPRCQVCERPLPTHPDNPHVCEKCGESFETTDELQTHFNKMHVKRKAYECHICYKKFTQQGGVMQHMRMHSGDRPFHCLYCPKSFTQKSGLDQHTRTHTKVKPYRCVVCGKCFIQSIHLKQHMRTHTNLTPFQCGICDKRFKQSSHLNYHLKNHNPVTMTTEQRQKYNALVGKMYKSEGSMEHGSEAHSAVQVVMDANSDENVEEHYVDQEEVEEMENSLYQAEDQEVCVVQNIVEYGSDAQTYITDDTYDE